MTKTKAERSSDSGAVSVAAKTETAACLAHRHAVLPYTSAGARYPSRSTPNPSKLLSSKIIGFDIDTDGKWLW